MSPERPESAELVLASPDGSCYVDFRMTAGSLIAQYVSVTDSRIYLLDLNSKEQSLLLGYPLLSICRLDLQYPDGKGFYFTTDSDANFRRLAYYEIDSGKVTILTEGIDWDVSVLLMSEDRTRGAFSVNAGGRDQVYLFDPTNHEYSRVSNVPVGRAFLGAFSPDNSQLAMTLNTATSYATGWSDVYTLSVEAEGMDHGPMTRWTSSEIAGLDASVEPSLIY